MDRINIVVAEDHTILREGLRALLEAETDFNVVGEAVNGKEALHCVATLKPDLVLMDLSMPNTNGTEAIRNIKRRFPDTKIITLTVHKTEEYVRAALQAGASGYMLKDDNKSELCNAIRSVLNGKTFLSPSVCGNVVSGFLGGVTNSLNSASSWESLTHREREVIKLIAEGLRNKEIAEYLSVSHKTIEKHRSNLMKKLNLHSAAAITTYAINNGLLSLLTFFQNWPLYLDASTPWL
jgi:DNA-binding NarL/FixJ family response regulator